MSSASVELQSLMRPAHSIAFDSSCSGYGDDSHGHATQKGSRAAFALPQRRSLALMFSGSASESRSGSVSAQLTPSSGSLAYDAHELHPPRLAIVETMSAEAATFVTCAGLQLQPACCAALLGARQRSLVPLISRRSEVPQPVSSFPIEMCTSSHPLASRRLRKAPESATDEVTRHQLLAHAVRCPMTTLSPYEQQPFPSRAASALRRQATRFFCCQAQRQLQTRPGSSPLVAIVRDEKDPPLPRRPCTASGSVVSCGMVKAVKKALSPAAVECLPTERPVSRLQGQRRAASASLVSTRRLPPRAVTSASLRPASVACTLECIAEYAGRL